MKNHEGHQSRFMNARCNICNVVSHAEISSDYGEFSSSGFYPDPSGFGYLCDECHSEIDDVTSMWDLEDEYEDE